MPTAPDTAPDTASTAPSAERSSGRGVRPSRLDQVWEKGITFGESLGGSIARSRVGRWWTRTTAPGLVEWAILAVLLLLSYAVFLYGDVRATFEHSFNFLDAVLSGHPRNFYTLSIEHTSTGHPAVYDIPLYAIFGIWNLPTYVIHRITGFDYLNSTPAELWLKTMMVVAAFAAARVLAGLAEDLGVDRARTRWVAFFFLSSMAVFMPVFVVVQYDIILVLVMLLGLRAYVRGDLKAFLGWFLLANTLKLFALFVFIPLVLLREKRIRVAGAQLVVGLIGLALCRALYHGDPGYAAATSGFTDGMMSRLIATGIGWIGGSAPLMTIPFFVVFMVGLVIYSYAVRPEDRNERNVLAVYLCMAVYLVFMVIVPLNPYWIALLAPFIVLIVFLSPRHLLLNSVLEVVITGCTPASAIRCTPTQSLSSSSCPTSLPALPSPDSLRLKTSWSPSVWGEETPSSLGPSSLPPWPFSFSTIRGAP